MIPYLQQGRGLDDALDMPAYTSFRSARRTERTAARRYSRCCFPRHLNFDYKSGDQHVVIKNGELVEGIINEKLVGQGDGALILKIFEEFGPDFTEMFLLNMAKMSLRAAYRYGVTIGIERLLPAGRRGEGARSDHSAGGSKVQEL